MLTDGIRPLKSWEGMRIYRTHGEGTLDKRRGRMGDIDKLIGSGKVRKVVRVCSQ